MRRVMLRRRAALRGRGVRRRLVENDLETAIETDPAGEAMIARIADDLDERRNESIGYCGSDNKKKKKTKCKHETSADKPDVNRKAYDREQKEVGEYVRKLLAEAEKGNERAFETCGISKIELLKRMKNWIARNEKEIEEAQIEKLRLKQKYEEVMVQIEKTQESLKAIEKLLNDM
ncbi:hypothetical protein QR680_015376 [Steinernema hermaphroditum]|uniref:Uncharacterized protein n=1 Tax=Steinernema hermaphroditum TaxID=289476 RepID=A0AA39H7G6_9BILA|nr:hypothetical protein QR680_015376 [Steinernema hermaphroditum]